MPRKQSIFRRIANLFRANVNAAISAAEDPKVMTDQLVVDYSNDLRQAEKDVAEAIANLRLLEKTHADKVAEIDEWEQRAIAANIRAEKAEANGHETERVHYLELAKSALKSQIVTRRFVEASTPQIAEQQQVIESLKTALNKMQDNLGVLLLKRDELAARAKVAKTKNNMIDSIQKIDPTDLTSELGRFEGKVTRMEALADGKADVAASKRSAQFQALDELDMESEVATSLEAIQSGKPLPELGA